jgi:UPF0755 protein
MTDRRPYDIEDDLGESYDDTYDDGYHDPAAPQGEWAPPSRPRYAAPTRGGGGGRGRLLLGVAVVLLLVLGAAGVWVARQINPSGSPGEVRTITVPEGASSSSIGDLLADEGIITSAFVWDWYLRVNGGGPFQAGEYQLAEDSSMGDVVDSLSDGPAPPEERRYTVPEGFTLSEILDRLADPEKGLGIDADELRQLMDSGQVRSAYQPADQPSNEGILFPETYSVDPEATPLQVLQQMVAELDATMAGLEVESAQERFNLTPYEILVVASLIEEETKIPEERPMVARVIYNRLRQGIPLGIDATSRYEAEVEGRDRGDIDFTSSSPYNTRRVKGLPPTPIASPGRASIEAALNPADGPWTFYVLEDEAGHHFFTDSNSEFLAAKDRCEDAGLGCG